MEFGCCKYFLVFYIMFYWYVNCEVLFKFIELVYKFGIRGFVVDEKGFFFEGVRIIIENCVKKIKIFKDGDFWWFLVLGNYIVCVVKCRYKNFKKIVIVELDVLIVVNFILVRKNLNNFNRCWLVMKFSGVVEFEKLVSNVSFYLIVIN